MRTEEKLNAKDIFLILFMCTMHFVIAFIITFSLLSRWEGALLLSIWYFQERCYLLGQRIIVDRKLFNLRQDYDRLGTK